MFNSFAHYLSYGATDQQTARQLTGFYDGLLVPGTVAAFQADGTRGFVLTLSASSRETKYVIDPRFPLFQQRLESPKKSHEALAERLDAPWLIRSDRDPRPEDFDDARVEGIAKAWLEFNGGYTTVSDKHFAKYADRLGEAVLPQDSKAPEYTLPPYTISGADDGDWWDVSRRLWDASTRQVRGTTVGGRLVRVVAVSEARAMSPLLRGIDDERVAIWCSNLNELETDLSGQRELREYGLAIREASTRGVSLFALYGGFFAVLLTSSGLCGASHGIGYGEARDWVELPRSGPPPARYYLPLAHRYVSQDLALLLWRDARSLVECDCLECDGQSPALLDYQALMRHSVRCRHAEIVHWSERVPQESAHRLDADARRFADGLEYVDVPRPLRRHAEQCYAHLRGWGEVLRALSGMT